MEMAMCYVGILSTWIGGSYGDCSCRLTDLECKWILSRNKNKLYVNLSAKYRV